MVRIFPIYVRKAWTSLYKHIHCAHMHLLICVVWRHHCGCCIGCVCVHFRTVQYDQSYIGLYISIGTSKAIIFDSRAQHVWYELLHFNEKGAFPFSQLHYTALPRQYAHIYDMLSVGCGRVMGFWVQHLCMCVFVSGFGWWCLANGLYHFDLQNIFALFDSLMYFSWMFIIRVRVYAAILLAYVRW